MDDLNEKKEEMIIQQIENRGINNKRVINAMRVVKREMFVGKQNIRSSYYDGPLPIGYGQTISQPYIVAIMTELIEPNKSDKILEIGTGSGYQTAVIAELAGEIYTIERIKELSDGASILLNEKMGYSNIKFRVGDGKEGWKDKAPFDKIMITAAASEFPEMLFSQLKDGGIAVAPVGDKIQYLYKYIKKEDGIKQIPVFAVSFVPLI
jgi:protein-L-isoaspartate(D-aspartate) O-methyltransferase